MTKVSNEEQINNANVPLSSRSYEFWDGFNFACDLLEDLGYAKSSTHPYNIADCLKAKMNRLSKNKVRKNGR
jgi:hypothetical protein